MKYIIIIALSQLILLSLLVIGFPEYLILPGHLRAEHTQLEQNCLSCHVLFAGINENKCLACHNPIIGKQNVINNIVDKPDSSLVEFHILVAEENCIYCHIEHQGKGAKREINKFNHTMLSSDLQFQCQRCHLKIKPSDFLHSTIDKNCNSCHSSTSWKNAEFDHKQLGENQLVCIRCHAEIRPNDTIHNNSDTLASCDKCHSTTGWKPATFAHEQYFRFDQNHPATCNQCHTANDGYATYTCYACHEHSQQKTASEHREEGITDFQNCVRCHRSGNEHEIIGDVSSKERRHKNNKDHEGRRHRNDDDDD